jgi:antitoxin ParD1/3/4
MTTVTVSMPESLKQFLETEVETKGFGNVSEYIRSLLRDAQARSADTRLDALLMEGLRGDKDIRLTPEFWKELRADASRILATHGKGKQKRARK